MSRNPVLWLVIALPLLAVGGSVASMLLAVGGSDAPLPERYHWEGSQLDADDARLAVAARRGISAAFDVDAAAGECRIVLQGAAPTVQLPGEKLATTSASSSGEPGGMPAISSSVGV